MTPLCARTGASAIVAAPRGRDRGAGAAKLEVFKPTRLKHLARRRFAGSATFRTAPEMRVR